MKLPTISTPIYSVQLVSVEEPVKFRPFLVKEHKLLLMASEGNSSDDVLSALKEIAKNCVVDDIDIDNLPLVDLELLFLHFRARSMGEKLDVYYKCKNEVNGKDCGMMIEASVNLLEVPVVNRDVERRIMITDEVGIQLKIPTFEYAKKILEVNADEDPDADLKAIAGIVEYVFDADNVYYAKDATEDEMVHFLEGIPQEKFDSVERFFDNLPTVRVEIEKICPLCGFKHDFKLEGLNDFFH